MRKILKTTAVISALMMSTIAQANVAVIVHLDNNANITQKDAQRIYLGKSKKFPDGLEALPVNLPKGSQTVDSFNGDFLGRNTSQVTAYWSKLVFTGKGTPPRELDSVADMIQLVSTNRNAIGYVNEKDLVGDVKVLFTIPSE
jgi:ABC-type phosphate transport system substrate-binding protein